jgi:ATP-dependent DNA helicase RecQ
MTRSEPPLLDLLKRYFGFSSFRPLQEEIIRDSLAGRDVFALLPTGGGKSLCFQLPALARPGLTAVVSPLIALMKDQVDALAVAGVPATFLNSSLDSDQSRERYRALYQGQFRLLYLAPERLMLNGTLEALKNWGLSAIAIDEAHCISEWGHDFRPEYREIASLRQLFPQIPMMALTATATERVRKDIIAQLHLNDPRCYQASFNRSNLSYSVIGKAKPYQELLRFLRPRFKESGIVYCQSRRSVESTAERLVSDGIAARPYHAGLTAEERSLNQEAFLRDDARVMVATVAFGMGINKPNVRFVVHHDLPKNIESYYQETGRAGRDGLPSECLLLFSPGDVIKYIRFIDEKSDAQERAVAKAQLNQMVQYAESGGCRRASLLGYFGERYPSDGCGACDNCQKPRETYDGTLEMQKFLSCVYRIREKSGFDVGLNHVIEVLTGGDTEKIARFHHRTLSTYGIGTEHSRAEWAAIGRELIRIGFLGQRVTDTYAVVEVTLEGRQALRERKTVMLTRPLTVPKTKAPRDTDVAYDTALFERLRALRKRLADERGVPPYVVFSDVSLRQMASQLPFNSEQFLRINGVGEKKLREFGDIFLNEIAEHVSTTNTSQ